MEKDARMLTGSNSSLPVEEMWREHFAQGNQSNGLQSSLVKAASLSDLQETAEEEEEAGYCPLPSVPCIF